MSDPVRDVEMNPDSESVYDEQISPLMEQIIGICKAHQIPMVASFQLQEDMLCTTNLPFKGRAENLNRAAVAIENRPQFAAFTITTSATK